VRPVFPTLTGKFQFCPDWALEAIERAVEAAFGAQEPRSERWLVLGFSGGAQCAHRAVWRRPERIAGCVALGAGCWTDANGTAHGMMVEENWFARPDWSDAEIPRWRDQAAQAGWERVRWLVGCGTEDHEVRLASARAFHVRLGARAEVEPFLAYPGAHVPPHGAQLELVARVLTGWAAAEGVAQT
jgi:pimeloyl-ACP methyl ester carboxylesterase